MFSYFHLISFLLFIFNYLENFSMVGVRIKIFLLGSGCLIRKKIGIFISRLYEICDPSKNELQISATSASGPPFYWLEGARTQNAGLLPLCQGTLVKELFSLAGSHHICCHVKNTLWKSVCKMYREQ